MKQFERNFFPVFFAAVLMFFLLSVKGAVPSSGQGSLFSGCISSFSRLGAGASPFRAAFSEPPETEASGTPSFSASLPLLSDDELVLLPAQSNAQMLSAVLRANDGSLIVLDGGWESDGPYLLRLLQKNGGHVRAWLLSHPHADHAGALLWMLRQGLPGLSVDHIYAPFAETSWYQSAAPEDPGIADALAPEFAKLPEGCVISSLPKGTTLSAGDLQVTVMNERYQLFSDPVNNSCVVYRIDGPKKSVLFLGDLGYEGGRQLLLDYGIADDGDTAAPQDAANAAGTRPEEQSPGSDVLPEDSPLHADYVQMAHHGQNGVGKAVYEAIAPSACFWPTPAWLWDNDSGAGPGSGPWKTAETKAWMRELSVTAHYCTKDGIIHALLGSALPPRVLP